MSVQREAHLDYSVTLVIDCLATDAVGGRL